MIQRDPPSLLTLFFIVRGSIVPKILPQMLLVALLALALVGASKSGIAIPNIPLQAFWVFGIALSLFLGFRSNTSYDRWWEGRRLWGQLIADFRSLRRESTLFITDVESRNELLSLSVAFAHLLRAELRGDEIEDDLSRWLDSARMQRLLDARHSSDAALNDIGDLLARLHQQGQCSEMGLRVLAERLAAMSLAQAGSERIANTPLPFVYSLLVKRTTYLYCLLIPFGLIATAGWLTPLFTAIMAYVFFGLDAASDELAAPFDEVANGLPLAAMCRTIDNAIAEATGRSTLPALAAIDGLLR
jgi:putative membrane protein